MTSQPLQGEGGDSEPDWVASERKVFQTERDSDGDGFMTFEEIKQWIIPEVRIRGRVRVFIIKQQTQRMF